MTVFCMGGAAFFARVAAISRSFALACLLTSMRLLSLGLGRGMPELYTLLPLEFSPENKTYNRLRPTPRGMSKSRRQHAGASRSLAGASAPGGSLAGPQHHQPLPDSPSPRRATVP